MARKGKGDGQPQASPTAPAEKTLDQETNLAGRLRERPSRPAQPVKSPAAAQKEKRNQKVIQIVAQANSQKKDSKSETERADPEEPVKSSKKGAKQPKTTIKPAPSKGKTKIAEAVQSDPEPPGSTEHQQVVATPIVPEQNDGECSEMLSKRAVESQPEPLPEKRLLLQQSQSAQSDQGVLGLTINIPAPSLVAQDSSRLSSPPPTPVLTQHVTAGPLSTAPSFGSQQFTAPKSAQLPPTRPQQISIIEGDDDDDDMIEMLHRNKPTNSAKKGDSSSNPAHHSGANGNGVPKHLNFTNEDFVHEKNQRVDDAYYFIKPPIGSGLFGAVYKAKHKKSGVIRAIKRIKKDHVNAANLHSLLNDVEILKKLDHPNIIKVYEFYQDEAAYYVVTDLCTGGELFDTILKEKVFTESRAAEYMRQILSAIAYCHDKNLVHCDLKPENIMLESAESTLIKVIDFGNSSVCTKDQKLSNKFGSVYYVAPEVLNSSYNEKCDVWSLGVILYLLLTGKPPFNGNSDQQILQKVYTGTYTMDIPEMSEISSGAKDLIKKMLTFNADQRISARECVNHPWIKQEGMLQELSAGLTINRRSLRNLKTFRSESMLQEAVMYFIVNQLTGKEEKEDLMNVFLSLDSDNDGKLKREDLILGYIKMGEDPDTVESLVDEILKNIDKNDKGFIDYSEYVTVALSKRKLFSEDKLIAAFKIFGGDEKGYIEAEDFKNTLCKGAFASVDENIWAGLINEVAGDEGHITFESFKKMMSMFTANEQVTQSLAF